MTAAPSPDALGGAGGRVRPSHVGATTLRVRYAETDRMGVAYHAEFLVWFEVGRADWIRTAVPAEPGRSYRVLEAAGFFLPVVEASSRYHSPARYDDELLVRTTLASASRVRFEFEYEVSRPDDGVTLATGRTVHAVTGASGRLQRLPETWLAWVVGRGPQPGLPSGE